MKFSLSILAASAMPGDLPPAAAASPVMAGPVPFELLLQPQGKASGVSPGDQHLQQDCCELVICPRVAEPGSEGGLATENTPMPTATVKEAAIDAESRPDEDDEATLSEAATPKQPAVAPTPIALAVPLPAPLIHNSSAQDEATEVAHGHHDESGAKPLESAPLSTHPSPELTESTLDTVSLDAEREVESATSELQASDQPPATAIGERSPFDATKCESVPVAAEPRRTASELPPSAESASDDERNADVPTETNAPASRGPLTPRAENPQPISSLQPAAATVLPSNRTEARPSEPSGPALDTARLIQRVARAMRSARGDESDREIRIRLSPPELGALKLEIHVQDGTLTARLETETSAAQAAIVENLPLLRERLAEQGLRIERFDVDLRQFGTDQSPGGSPHDRQPAPPPPAILPSRVQLPAEKKPQPVTARPHAKGRINVIV